MPDVVELRGVRLTPVIELEPATFSTQAHPKETPEEWADYWRVSLADSGISGVNPIVPGSWHVSTSDFTVSQLEKVLRVIVDDRVGFRA
jgi:hypothetical protein